ncbi:SurA N-terminal domain-containing protein [Gayadomonas joobiniege]|uniref:SurA N-terminal domain-containing protein n=1 Tax=Gayadomonas joobiniege TaxID=1234606 RepID=UPI00037C4667|nr:SurA N-terminal domain-containing protein [Gayadomonas joobiniege]
MLERIREGSQGPVAKVILILVIFSFALAGVGSYINSGSEPNAAEVNGLEIKRSRLERAFETERARMESQYGDMFSQLASDPNYMNSFRQGVLQRLISEQLILDFAQRQGIRVSDQEIKKAIFDIPAFQVDGKFNNDRYLQVLTRNTMTPAQFRESMRQDLTRSAVIAGLAESDFVLSNEAELLQSLQLQTRNLDYVEVPVAKFESQVELSEEEINSYYENHITQYETNDSLDLAYIELKLEDVADDIEVEDSEIESLYQSTSQNYTNPEQRRASHILIDLTDGEESAKAEAEDLLAQIKSGADFAELAKEHSDDTFSGENGGDLNYFGRGAMDPAFEEATFALQEVGEVSDVVKSDFGYHIIKLTNIQAEQVRPLDEVKDEIKAQLQRDKARDIFIEKQQQLADVAFEKPDTLADAAEATGLTVQNTGLQDTNSQQFPFDQNQVVQAAMSNDVLEQGYNSNLIELSSEHSVVVRVNEYQPARTRPLEEVREDVVAALTAEKANSLAEEWVAQQADKWSQGEDINAALAELSLTLESADEVARFGSDLAQPIAAKAFEMARPQADKQSASWTQVDNQTLALIKVNAVNTPENVTVDETTKQRLQSVLSEYNYRGLVASLRNNADIKVYQTSAESAE